MGYTSRGKSYRTTYWGQERRVATPNIVLRKTPKTAEQQSKYNVLKEMPSYENIMPDLRKLIIE